MPPRLRIRTLVTALLVCLAAGPAAAEEPAATVIVFDGSGSMWNRFEGEKVAKFVTAAGAIKASLAKLKPELRVGLAAFGHRRQGDCSDAQVVLAPDALSATGDKIGTFLDKINPKGKGPLTAALREAAKSLPADAGQKSLILFHDDPDNCVPDACAALPELQAAAPGVVIHVVGLGVKGEDAQKYQCLTKPTGGRFIDGQTAASVQSGIEEVFGAIASGPAKPAPPPVAAVRPPAPPPQPIATPAPSAPPPYIREAPRLDGPPALRLATVLTAGQAPTGRHVHWTVRRADAGERDRPVFVGTGQDVVVPLPPGSYAVEARDGAMPPIEQKVTLEDKGWVALDIPLTAGLVRASAPQDAADTTTLRILEPASDGAAAKPFGTFNARDLATGVAVPAGKWLLRIADGPAQIERTVDIKAGAAVDLGAPWPFGRIQLSISGASAATRQPVVVVAYEDDADAPRGRREIARSASEAPELVLPVGTYTLVARQGAIEVRDRVSLQGGEIVKRNLILAGARVTLTSRFAGGGQPPPEEPVAYRIERLDVVPPEVFASNRQTAELDLPAGRYRIEARHGLVNARAIREVTLTSGQTTAVVLEQQAAAIRFMGPPGAAGEHLWEILDASGYPLWSTVQTSPRAILQAGRYIVRLDIRDKRIERSIEVRAGQVGSVEVKD